jgi:hypothetical protein
VGVVVEEHRRLVA